MMIVISHPPEGSTSRDPNSREYALPNAVAGESQHNLPRKMYESRLDLRWLPFTNITCRFPVLFCFLIPKLGFSMWSRGLRGRLIFWRRGRGGMKFVKMMRTTTCHAKCKASDFGGAGFFAKDCVAGVCYQ